jgi:hypothetical protein
MGGQFKLRSRLVFGEWIFGTARYIRAVLISPTDLLPGWGLNPPGSLTRSRWSMPTKASGTGNWRRLTARACRHATAWATAHPNAAAMRCSTQTTALQGGLLLAQVQRDTRPLQTTLDTLFALASAT